MAITKIQSESLNLADDFAFTGTITGAGGVTETDIWRLTSDKTGANGVSLISANLSRATNNANALLGTGMTESSGTFTFPSTGYWYVEANLNVQRSGNTDNYGGCDILVTTNNSTYNVHARGFASVGSGDGQMDQVRVSAFIDVTDTSNVKARFQVNDDSTSIYYRGESTMNESYFRFTRFGDT